MAHAAATWFLVGLIWVIQRVHYPSMHFVDSNAFAAFEAEHCRSIGRIVAPAMLLEGALAAVLIPLAPGALDLGLAGIGAGLAGIVWGSTFFVQVPLHNRLQRGKNTDTINRLIATNWIRTAAWSARGGIAVALLLSALR